MSQNGCPNIQSTAPTGLSSAINARPVTTVRTSKPNRCWSKRRDAAVLRGTGLSLLTNEVAGVGNLPAARNASAFGEGKAIVASRYGSHLGPFESHISYYRGD